MMQPMGNNRENMDNKKENQAEPIDRDRMAENVQKIGENESDSPRLLVSFTSYPPRIRFVPTMLETIYQQTLPADEVILWLAEEEFPGKEKDLPDELLAYAAEGKLSIRWCSDNLKSHKKYFYICQERPDDLIVTVDDDLLYPPELLQNLYDSYLQYPDAISAARVHLIPITEAGEIMPYRLWIREEDYTIGIPSLHLFSTSGAGTLFPPHILPGETFDVCAIEENCLLADDLWLKTMELYSDIPVVLAAKHPGLRYIEGTQEISLYSQNKNETGNDFQLENVRKWTKLQFGLDVWEEKLLHPTVGANLCGLESVCAHAIRQIDKFSGMAKHAKKRNEELNEKLKETKKEAGKEKSELNARLQQANREKSNINAKLQQANRKANELSAKLQQTYKEKSELNAKLQQTYKEKAERGEKIKEMESHFLVKVDRKLHKIWNRIFRKNKEGV